MIKSTAINLKQNFDIIWQYRNRMPYQFKSSTKIECESKLEIESKNPECKNVGWIGRSRNVFLPVCLCYSLAQSRPHRFRRTRFRTSNRGFHAAEEQSQLRRNCGFESIHWSSDRGQRLCRLCKHRTRFFILVWQFLLEDKIAKKEWRQELGRGSFDGGKSWERNKKCVVAQ